MSVDSLTQRDSLQIEAKHDPQIIPKRSLSIQSLTLRFPWVVLLLTALGRAMMAYDMVTDILVVLQLEKTKNKHPKFFAFSIFLLLSQYVVIWVMLWRPFLKTKQDRRWGLLSLFFYALFGIPALVLIDISFFSIFLFTPGDKHQYLLYYERLRSVTESFTESLPEAIFQIYISLDGDFDIPQYVLTTSIAAAICASLKNLWQLKNGAKKVGLPFRDFLKEVAKAGVGAIPFKAIKEGNITEVRLVFDMSDEEMEEFVQALQDPSSKVSKITFRLAQMDRKNGPFNMHC